MSKLLSKTGISLMEYNLKDHDTNGSIIIDNNNSSIPLTLELNSINKIELKGTIIISDDDEDIWYDYTITLSDDVLVLLFDDIEYYDKEKELTKAKEYQILSYILYDFLASSVNRVSYYNDDIKKYVVEVDDTLALGTGLYRSVRDNFKYNNKRYVYSSLNTWSIIRFSDSEHPHKITTSNILKNLADYF